MKTKLGLLILMLMTSIGCRSDSPAAQTEEEHIQTSPSKQKAVRENTLVLTDFEKDETVFSFQGGGLLKLMAKEDLEKADLWLEMPHGMASNNSQLDDDLTGLGGLVDLGTKAIQDIVEIPLYGYQLTLSPEEIRSGHTYCVRTADGKQYGLFQVIDFDSKAATLKITWRYPVGKPVANKYARELTQQDLAAIVDQPHQPITDVPELIPALLKPGIYERTGKVEVQETPQQPARTIERRFIKTIRHAHGKYVVIETTDEEGTLMGWQVQCYDPLLKRMQSTILTPDGARLFWTGMPEAKPRTVLWEKPPTKDDSRSIALTITIAPDGLGAKIEALAHRKDTLLAITTAELKRIGDLPVADR